MKRKLTVAKTSRGKAAAPPVVLLTEVRELIVSVRQTVARGVNLARCCSSGKSASASTAMS